MRTITAKFKSVCASTGQTICKGEICKYDPDTRKCYKLGYSPSNGGNESRDEALHVQANEDAYFDHFCQMNNL